jgi:hypothetical protein
VYTPADSNQGWHEEWFYIRNPAGNLFPLFMGVCPVRKESWTWGPLPRRRRTWGSSRWHYGSTSWRRALMVCSSSAPCSPPESSLWLSGQPRCGVNRPRRSRPAVTNCGVQQGGGVMARHGPQGGESADRWQSTGLQQGTPAGSGKSFPLFIFLLVLGLPTSSWP